MNRDLATRLTRLYAGGMVSPPPQKTGKPRSFMVRLNAEYDEKLLRIERHGPYSTAEAIRVAIDMADAAIAEEQKKKQHR